MSDLLGPPMALEVDQEKKLLELFPPFADLVRRFVLEARAQGMPIAIFEGLRTFERQQELYNKGRDSSGKVINESLVVTKAPPGSSLHNYGLAVDVVFDSDQVKPGWQWSWDDKYPWKKLADLSITFGLEPAYYWKSMPESPHHQKTYALQIHELLSLYRDGGLLEVWAELQKHVSL